MHVLTRILTFNQRQLRADLLPLLLGKVFHVTSETGLKGILADGFVSANQDGRFSPSFPQSSNGYGRRRGYVCLFDLRYASPEHVSHTLDCFNFLDPRATENQDPAFLLLDESAMNNAIPWTAARADGNGEMWIWHTEAWFPGDLPLNLVKEVLRICVRR